MDAAELESLLDREQIREVIGLLARGEDRRDADLIRAAVWPDARLDYGIFQGDFAAYLDWVVPGSPAIPVTQHLLGQTVIRLTGGSALAETQATNYHRIDMGAEERDLVLGGRYLDELEERDGEWRITRRTMLYDWLQDHGVSVDWSNGVMGTPFSGDHYTGRAAGDHSAIFFGE